MAVFKRNVSQQELNSWIPQVVRYAGVETISLDEQGLSCQFLVGDQNVQPFGMLHGGVSVMVAETLGSIGANLCLDDGFFAVGQGLSASHISSARIGEKVMAYSEPLHVGKSSQVWNTDFFNESKKLICRVTLTVAVRAAKNP